MDNNSRVNRIKTLLSSIESGQLSYANVDQGNLRFLSDEAYREFQDYLEHMRVTTIDELLNKVISRLKPDQKEKISKRLNELNPKQGLQYFQKPVNMAKFLLYGYISLRLKIAAAGPRRESEGLILKIAPMPYFYYAKAFSVAFRLQMLMEATRAGYALSEEADPLIRLFQTERQTLLDGLQAELEALGTEILDGELGIKSKDVAGVQMTNPDAEAISAKIDQAVTPVEKYEGTEADAIATAAKTVVWTKVSVAVNIVAIAGINVWNRYNDTQNASELREQIAKLVTSRLSAKHAERQALVHLNQITNMSQLTAGVEERDPGTQDFALNLFANTMSNALLALSLDNTYNELVASDKESHADMREDPSLTEIKKRIGDNAAKTLAPKPVTTT